MKKKYYFKAINSSELQETTETNDRRESDDKLRCHMLQLLRNLSFLMLSFNNFQKLDIKKENLAPEMVQ